MIPANHKTIKEGYKRACPTNLPTREEREIAESLKNKPKAYIQDVCDLCLQKGFVMKKWMQKRKFGLRFGCKECLQKGLFAGWDESYPNGKGKYVHLYRGES